MTQNESLQAKFLALGKLIDVGGFRMHLHSMGEGRPAVVFEAAIGDFSPTWSLVQPEVAQFAWAMAYDRAGLGWSESSPRPRTAAVMVEELRTLLDRAGIPGPYVLVGQSFSGLLARLFAHQYPQEVAGLVLADPAHEDQFERFPEAIRAAFNPMKDMQLQQLRQIRALVQSRGPEAAPPLLPIPGRFPLETAEIYRRQSVADATRIDTMIAEMEGLEESQAQVRAARPAGLEDLPLVVLSHGQPQVIPGLPEEVNREYEQSWQQMQIELASLSSQGRRLVAEASGHMVHHDRPDLVIEAIREIVETWRE